MITYATHKAVLDNINPFIDWHLLDRELVFSQAMPLKKYKGFAVPITKMRYGDSIFVPMALKYFKCMKHKIRNKQLRDMGIEAQFFMKDPTTKEKGLRVWSFRANHTIKNPRILTLTEKLAA